MEATLEKKEGFQKTKIGWIPIDWEVKVLGEIGETVNGLTYSPKDINENGVLVLRSSNVQNRQIVFDDNVFVSVEDGKYNPVLENDILICVRNGSRSLIGKNALISEESEGMAFGAFMAVYRSPLNKYIIHLLDTDLYNREIHKNLGATINSINGSNLRKFKFPIPPQGEREKIAKVLSTWDQAISETQSLINQLNARKKGLMQQLLTGKKRLKGFDKEWDSVQLGDYLKKHSEVSSENNQFPVLTSSRHGLYFQSDYYKKEVASKDNTGYNVVPRGYFTYRHMSDDLVFKFNINELCDKGIVSTLYPVFTVKDGLHKEYLLNLLNEGEEFRRHALKQKQGGSRTYMYFGKLSQMEVRLPSIEEQNAIVAFINTIDSEILSYSQKLDSFTNQKKGLMQQLLKGQKRVKV